MNFEHLTSLPLLEQARHHDEPSWRRLATLYGPWWNTGATAAALARTMPPT